ncbi:nuclease [Nanoarchaeota archaeon]|nr:MAG: nuclease [Nanoarchaeota archaeon]
MRNLLEDHGLLRTIDEIVTTEEIPTTAGVDGTYIIERTLSSDIVAVAAVAVEGLIPPRETRFWPTPRHRLWIYPLEHAERTPVGVRGLMLGMEVQLASVAPHRVVMLDGSFTTFLIAFGQVMNSIGGEEGLLPQRLTEVLIDNMESYLRSYLEILKSERTDKNYIALPKYSSRREVSEYIQRELEYNIRMNDKALLSLILRPGEMVGPLRLTRQEDRWHLTLGNYFGSEDYPNNSLFNRLREKILENINDLHVMYVRVNQANPVLRVELPKFVASNNARLARVLLALRYQASITGILEPYPLYIADTIVKQIWPAIGSLKDTALTQLAEDPDISDVIISLNEYRTEGGF